MLKLTCPLRCACHRQCYHLKPQYSNIYMAAEVATMAVETLSQKVQRLPKKNISRVDMIWRNDFVYIVRVNF